MPIQTNFIPGHEQDVDNTCEIDRRAPYSLGLSQTICNNVVVVVVVVVIQFTFN